MKADLNFVYLFETRQMVERISNKA